MEDMLEQTNEIMETLGRPYGLPDDVDEDDLEAGELLVILLETTHYATLCGEPCILNFWAPWGGLSLW